MYRILKKRKLAEKIWLMDIQADRIAGKCLPGEFLIVRIDKQGERVPLTICDYNRETGVITIVFQVVGASTYRMAEELNEGDAFQDVVGPLGRPSELTEKTAEELQKMNILFVAGGVGTAPVYPQVKWLKEQGVSADVVQGSKNKDLVILEDEMKAVCGDHLFLCGFGADAPDCPAVFERTLGKQYKKVHPRYQKTDLTNQKHIRGCCLGRICSAIIKSTVNDLKVLRW